MDKVIMVACDLHDKSGLVKWALDRGKPEKLSFDNNGKGRSELIQQLHALRKKHQATRTVFAYEASACGFILHDALQAAEIECYVLAPTKMERSVKARKNKTDEKDCDQIMELLRGYILAGNKLPAVHVPNRQTRDDREVTRARTDLSQKLSRVKIQIRTLLKRHGIDRPEALKSSSFTKALLEWLHEFTAESSPLGWGARTALGSLLRQYGDLQAELKRLDRAVAELASQARHVTRVTGLVDRFEGVGVLSALVFLVEMGDMARFQNRRQVGANFGLAPAAYETGDTGDRKGHITKQGSGHLRRMLCQCAWARRRSDPTEKALAERLIAKNPKKKKIAVVALMRRLGVQMWHAALELSCVA
jgi:transposase